MWKPNMTKREVRAALLIQDASALERCAAAIDPEGWGPLRRQRREMFARADEYRRTAARLAPRE